MNVVDFRISRSVVPALSDFAVVDDDPAVGLVEAIIHAISTEIEITIDGVTMHLAAWLDPDHWSDDWAEKGIEDPHSLIIDAVRQRP